MVLFVKFYFITIIVVIKKIHNYFLALLRSLIFFLIGLICVDTDTTLDKRGML